MPAAPTIARRQIRRVVRQIGNILATDREVVGDKYGASFAFLRQIRRLSATNREVVGFFVTESLRYCAFVSALRLLVLHYPTLSSGFCHFSWEAKWPKIQEVSDDRRQIRRLLIQGWLRVWRQIRRLFSLFDTGWIPGFITT